MPPELYLENRGVSNYDRLHFDVTWRNCVRFLEGKMDIKLENITFGDVVRTDITDRAIEALDPHFAGNPVIVDSVKRTTMSQLKIIQNYAIEYKIIPADTFLILDLLVDYEGKKIYNWQLPWSRCLEIGLLIRPPYKAEILCGMRKGRIWDASDHILGIAFDIDGHKNPETIYTIIDHAIKIDPAVNSLIEAVVLERMNHCVHTKCFNKTA